MLRLIPSDELLRAGEEITVDVNFGCFVICPSADDIRNAFGGTRFAISRVDTRLFRGVRISGRLNPLVPTGGNLTAEKFAIFVRQTLDFELSGVVALGVQQIFEGIPTSTGPLGELTRSTVGEVVGGIFQAVPFSFSRSQKSFVKKFRRVGNDQTQRT